MRGETKKRVKAAELSRGTGMDKYKLLYLTPPHNYFLVENKSNKLLNHFILCLDVLDLNPYFFVNNRFLFQEKEKLLQYVISLRNKSVFGAIYKRDIFNAQKEVNSLSVSFSQF